MGKAADGLEQVCTTFGPWATCGLPKNFRQPTKNAEDVKESKDVMSVLSVPHLSHLPLVTTVPVMQLGEWVATVHSLLFVT